MEAIAGILVGLAAVLYGEHIKNKPAKTVVIGLGIIAIGMLGGAVLAIIIRGIHVNYFFFWLGLYTLFTGLTLLKRIAL